MPENSPSSNPQSFLLSPEETKAYTGWNQSGIDSILMLGAAYLLYGSGGVAVQAFSWAATIFGGLGILFTMPRAAWDSFEIPKKEDKNPPSFSLERLVYTTLCYTTGHARRVAEWGLEKAYKGLRTTAGKIFRREDLECDDNDLVEPLAQTHQTEISSATGKEPTLNQNTAQTPPDSATTPPTPDSHQKALEARRRADQGDDNMPPFPLC